jgi:hypothetical protein
MTEREMFEKSFERPTNYFNMPEEGQWQVDAELGILDWQAKDLSTEDLIRYSEHYK